MKPKRITAAQVAQYYNETFLDKKKQAFAKEWAEDFKKDISSAECQAMLADIVPVNAKDLSLKKFWDCSDSPTKFCVYDWEHTDEYCIFCGDPQERK